MLQELCPHCGNEWMDDTRPCPACGHEPVDPRSAAGPGASRRSRVDPMLLGLAASAALAAVVVSGFGFRPQAPPPDAGQAVSPRDASGPNSGANLLPGPRFGRVVFGEGLGAAMELESRRSRFAPGDTIAWRVEFVDAPTASEVTVVIAWQSIRERMELTRDTVALDGPRVTSIVRDAVPIGDLVPTAGLYSVSYFDGDAKLAEGVFEMLPPDR